jgi:hypothetical protein
LKEALLLNPRKTKREVIEDTLIVLIRVMRQDINKTQNMVVGIAQKIFN